MKVRIESIRLLGADRNFEFSSGLNIIVGSIATGKTTLQRCMRGLLGSGLENFPPARRAARFLTSGPSGLASRTG